MMGRYVFLSLVESRVGPAKTMFVVPRSRWRSLPAPSRSLTSRPHQEMSRANRPSSLCWIALVGSILYNDLMLG